jgi:hypothetical protein
VAKTSTTGPCSRVATAPQSPSSLEHFEMNEIADVDSGAMAPTGDDYMPLYCAVRWIVTNGHQADVSDTDAEAWDAAYAQLLSRIASDEVTLTGVQQGQRRKIEGYVVASIVVDHQHRPSQMGLTSSEDLYLRSFNLGDLYWNDVFDDRLCNRMGVHWTKLMVRQSDVLRCWPFNVPVDIPRRTGAPGRPSSMDPVFADDWPSLTAKTIENRIRHEFRRHQSRPRN